MIRRGGPLLVALLALLALSACTLDVEVRVRVDDDGGGTVEVLATADAAALSRIGGDLGAVLDLDALRAAGWTVEGPSALPDGSATVRLGQRFEDAAGAAEVFEDLEGEAGPLQGFTVTRSQSPFRTEWGFRGTVDLGGDVALPDGATEVDGQPVATIEELERQLGESLSRLLRLRVGVRLPGDVRSNATTKADNGAAWQVAFGTDPLELEATGSRTRTGMVALAVVLGLAVVVGLVALLIRIAGRVTAAGR
ncbi:MAG TPA: hypothetical protein VJ804_00385 [Acidimicrobiales bacterium]|nr:hypothetical protein [Acidimicrobiales bacterium]